MIDDKNNSWRNARSYPQNEVINNKSACINTLNSILYRGRTNNKQNAT